MALGLREAAHTALLQDARPEEAITVNQRALIDKILARYSAEFTVFRELLQNADDAGATECELRFATAATVSHPALPEERGETGTPNVRAPLTQWTFRNNGQVFSHDDWHRLRRIAEGNPDPDRIGAFGVGFYSLFSICEEPIVSSGSELMGFFWKGDALYTRRASTPQVDVSSTGTPWTTFLMALREPAPFPESPLALAQFLATSLTFTSNIRRIALYLDDHVLCKLDKEVGALAPLQASRHLQGTSPERLLRVQTMHSTPVHVAVRVARLILLEAAAEAEREKPSLKRTLASAFSKSASAGLTSMLTSALGTFSAKPSSLVPDTADLAPSAQLALVDGSLHLRMVSAHAAVSVDRTFAREIERSTKKSLPTSTPLHMVYMGKDELESSLAAPSPPDSTYGDVDKHVGRLFTGLMPSLDAQGRIFIGFRTHQTTSFSGHVAARFIPTVERESLDFVDRYCARWNMELVAISAFLARAVYEDEMQRIGTLWTSLAGDDHEERRAYLFDSALHAMRFFSFHASSPSSRVSAVMEERFYACCTRPVISLLSTQGARSSDAVRFPSAMLSEFVHDLAVLPPAHLEAAETFVTQLRARNLVRDITMDDVFTELSRRALRVDEMVACLKWWLVVAEHPSYDPSLRKKLVGGAMVAIPTDTTPRIQALSDVTTVLQPSKVPATVPLPPTCLVPEVSRQLPLAQLRSVFGWPELTVRDWLAYVITLDQSPAPEVVAAHGLTHSPANAERVLGTIGWAWGHLPQNERDAVLAMLAPLACIPTRQGMKRPEEAYFASVSLLADLPVVAFPTLAIKGNVEKLLEALHVRKHVEIQLIFDRLISAGDWSHRELVAYLAKHRDVLTAKEMERLSSTPIFPSEAAAEKRYRANQLYEPVDELRTLGLPLLGWQGKAWRSGSDEARLLLALGLRRHPPLAELLTMASMANPDEEERPKALRFLLTKFSTLYADAYTLSEANAHAFVPVRSSHTLLPPSQVFTDPNVATMNFRVAQLMPMDALHLQLRPHPESKVLVQRLLAQPPHDLDTARRVYHFLSTCGDLRREDLASLRTARIVPVQQGEQMKMAAPRDCYFLPRSDAPPEYKAIFDYIDFGPTAAVFLRSCGVSDEPSVEELVEKLVADPPRFYGLCGSTEAYIQVLRRIAEKQTTFSSELLYTLKRAPFLLGMRKKEAEGEQEYALRPPYEVVIVDDAHAHMLFSEHLYAAPPDDVLETQLYAPLGAKYLSELIDESYAVDKDIQHNTPRAKSVHTTILERTPLFLFEKRASGKKEIQRDFDWLRDALVVVEVGGSGVQLTRTLRYRNEVYRDVQRCSAVAVQRRSHLVLHLATDMDVDWFEVALALNKFLLTKQHLQEVLLFMTVLSTPLRSLKRKGFHVDKMLAQQQPTPSAPVAVEQNWSGYVDELRAMFPEADAAYLDSLVRSFNTHHVEHASEVLLRGEYPRRKDEAVGPSVPEKAPLTAPEGPGAPQGAAAPPSAGLVPRDPRQGAVPRSGAQPALDVSTMQGAAGGLFQHWKNRLGGTKLSSLADGTSSIRTPGPVLGPGKNEDSEHVTPTSHIQQHVQQAIQASRPDASRVIQSQAATREVRQAATSYCDVSGITTDLRLAGHVAGMQVYVSAELDAEKTLQNNAEALQRLIRLVYFPIGQIFQVDPRCLSVFCDTKGPSIAFNRGGSIFLNFRYYLAWHDEDVQAGRLAAPLVSVYFSMAHELAHNLVADHNSEHEFYFSSIAEQHFTRLAHYLAQLGA